MIYCHLLNQEIFKPRGISGGVNSTGRRLRQEGQRPLGGVVAQATACEDISYYNEKILTQQPSFLSQRQTAAQHL